MKKNNHCLLQFAAIPISDNYDLWMNFLNTLNTKVYKNKSVRCFKYREEISALVLRKLFCSKVVDNAFNDISHGANINEIQTATTADILYVVKSGVVPKLSKVVYLQMSDTSLTAIDLHVENCFH